MKLLLLDIETAPNVAYVWKLWKENVSLPQLIHTGYVLCWAAKWLGEDEIYFDSVHHSRPKTMLRRIHKLLEQADAVIHYNGTKFDIPTLNKEFLLAGLTPPATYKQIDLLTTSRNRFRFPSNKLEFVAKALGVGGKVKHSGFDLWVNCMNGDKEAWKQMEEYNKQDVVLLEKVYEVFKPWIRNHPNMAMYTGEFADPICPTCGGIHLVKRGYSVTHTGRYQRYRCSDCGTWSRSRSVLKTGDVPKLVTIQV